MTGVARRSPWWLVAAVPLVWLPYLLKWKLGLNSDSAIPFLMARRILDGELPVYAWRENYIGALDSYAAAGLMALFGRDHAALSYLPQLAAYVAGAALLVKQSPPELRGARAFLLLFAPPGLFVAIARCGLSQDALLWLGWAGLIALRPGLEPEPRSRGAWLRAAAAGGVLAAALYRIPSALIGFLALAVLAGLAASRGARAARLGQLALVFALGQLYRLPAWLAGVTPEMQLKTDFGHVPQHLEALAKGFLQFNPLASFGVTTSGLYTYYSGYPPALYAEPYASEPARSGGGAAIACFLAGLAGWGAALALRDGVRAARRGLRPEVHEAYWCLVFLALLAGFLVHPSVWDIGGARYLAALWFPLVVLVSSAVMKFRRRARGALAIAWVLLAAAGHGRMLRLEDALHRDLEQAAGWMRERGLDAGYADYWLGYVTVAFTKEELIFTPGYNKRYPPYTELVAGREEFAGLEWRRHVEERKRLRIPPGRYQVVDRATLGEVSVTRYRKTGDAPSGSPSSAPGE